MFVGAHSLPALTNSHAPLNDTLLCVSGCDTCVRGLDTTNSFPGDNTHHSFPENDTHEHTRCPQKTAPTNTNTPRQTCIHTHTLRPTCHTKKNRGDARAATCKSERNTFLQGSFPQKSPVYLQSSPMKTPGWISNTSYFQHT